jgi:predicted amidophosphoribosyltransferase
MDIFTTFSKLIFPNRCISCKRLGDSICLSCSFFWKHQYFRSTLTRPTQLSVYSSIQYSDVATKVFLAAKESSVRSADFLVAEAISHSLREWLREEWIDTLIPIPSRKSIARKRGRQFMEEISLLVTQELGLRIAPILSHTRTVRDQSTLSAQGRWNNLHGSMVVSGNPLGLGKVLVVDDLVTTGATLSEAARALRYAGIEVIGAVTAAIAQPVR